MFDDTLESQKKQRKGIKRRVQILEDMNQTDFLTLAPSTWERPKTCKKSRIETTKRSRTNDNYDQSAQNKAVKLFQTDWTDYPPTTPELIIDETPPMKANETNFFEAPTSIPFSPADVRSVPQWNIPNSEQAPVRNDNCCVEINTSTPLEIVIDKGPSKKANKMNYSDAPTSIPCSPADIMSVPQWNIPNPEQAPVKDNSKFSYIADRRITSDVRANHNEIYEVLPNPDDNQIFKIALKHQIRFSKIKNWFLRKQRSTESSSFYTPQSTSLSKLTGKSAFSQEMGESATRESFTNPSAQLLHPVQHAKPDYPNIYEALKGKGHTVTTESVDSSRLLDLNLSQETATYRKPIIPTSNSSPRNHYDQEIMKIVDEVYELQEESRLKNSQGLYNSYRCTTELKNSPQCDTVVRFNPPYHGNFNYSTDPYQQYCFPSQAFVNQPPWQQSTLPPTLPPTLPNNYQHTYPSPLETYPSPHYMYLPRESENRTHPQLEYVIDRTSANNTCSYHPTFPNTNTMYANEGPLHWI